MKIRQKIAVSVIALTAMATSAANAATYNFTVNYSGGGNAVLAPGSDDMLAATLASGDTINYTFTAAGVGYWTALTASPSIFGAIGDLYGTFGPVDFNYTASFLANGSTVFTDSGSGSQGDADLGPRSLPYSAGVKFDTFTETLGLTSITLNINDPNSDKFASILPNWPAQYPEQTPNFSFTNGAISAVPEPATWAMLLMGLFGAGVMVRGARRKDAVATA